VSTPRVPPALPVPRKPRADDGDRTRDPQLGKLMLYQLSYVRARATIAPLPRSSGPRGHAPNEGYPCRRSGGRMRAMIDERRRGQAAQEVPAWRAAE
jgi:hypothetical protein